jgi:hypothetical protein
MTARASSQLDAFQDAAFSDIYDLMHGTIRHQLAHGLYERLDTDYLHGAIANTPQISGAIFLSLHPKQLTLLITDARISVILAIQRHLDNEQYRKRLSKEFHYRALRQHLSEDFRMLMVPPSNSKKYSIATRRKPSLAMAYQAEIEHLELNHLAACQHRPVDVMYGSCLRMRR